MQYKKVLICGVDTAALPILTEKQKEELLKKVKNGDKCARDTLIGGNLRLVLSVIQRFQNRGENPDDLFQVGCIGLIKSIDNFDITQNVRFSTYAVPMIIGEIRRYLRDNNMVRVSRSIKDTAYKAMQVKENFINKFQREPTVEEIAKELDMPKEDIVIALESVVEPVSLYEPVFSDGGDTIYMLDQIGDKNDDNTKYTMADAVFTACFLNMCIRNSDIVGMANFSPVVNTRGMIYTCPEGIVLRSTYHVFDAYGSGLADV